MSEPTHEQPKDDPSNSSSCSKAEAVAAWIEWAERRERETTFRRQLGGTPGNLAIDQACFLEGFKKGVEHALSKRT